MGGRASFHASDGFIDLLPVFGGGCEHDFGYFATDQAEMQQESRPQLEEMAKLLAREPKLQVLIVGHTDNRGDLASNQALSQRRAEAVMRVLTSQYQVDPRRLTARGVASLAPVASNRDEAGRALNRRVELVER